MTRDVIEDIAEKMGMTYTQAAFIAAKTGGYIRDHLSKTDISRFTFANLGTWKVKLARINNEITHAKLRYLRIMKESGDEERYEKAKEKFRYLWRLRNNAIHYKNSRKNAFNGIRKKQTEEKIRDNE